MRCGALLSVAFMFVFLMVFSSFAHALASDAYSTTSDYTYTNVVPNGHNANNIVVYLPGIGETTLQKALIQNTSGPMRTTAGGNLYYTQGNLSIGQQNAYDKLTVGGGAFIGSETGALSSSAGGGIRIFYDPTVNAAQIYAYNYTGAYARNLSLQQPGGNVGIGTNTPSQKLEVAGTIYSTSGGFKFPDGTTQTTAAASTSANTTGTMTSGYVQKATSGSALGNSRIYETGNYVGIGTTSPAAPLTITADGSVIPGAILTINDTDTSVGAVTWPVFSISSAYPTGFNGNTSFEITGGGVIEQYYRNSHTVQNVISAAGNSYLLMNGNNLGIGTASPSQKLEVAGTIYSNAGGFKFPDGTTQTTAFGSSNANITGAMSAGYIQKSTSGSAVGNSVIYESGGNVDIGTTSGTYKLNVNGAVSATAYWYTSDRRFKKNIESLDDEQMLDKVLALNPVAFDWKTSDSNTDAQIGLIAQDVEKVIPQLVSTASDGTKSVEYGNMVAPLIAAVQAQQREIDQLKAEIKELKSK